MHSAATAATRARTSSCTSSTSENLFTMRSTTGSLLKTTSTTRSSAPLVALLKIVSAMLLTRLLSGSISTCCSAVAMPARRSCSVNIPRSSTLINATVSAVSWRNPGLNTGPWSSSTALDTLFRPASNASLSTAPSATLSAVADRNLSKIDGLTFRPSSDTPVVAAMSSASRRLVAALSGAAQLALCAFHDPVWHSRLQYGATWHRPHLKLAGFPHLSQFCERRCAGRGGTTTAAAAVDNT